MAVNRKQDDKEGSGAHGFLYIVDGLGVQRHAIETTGTQIATESDGDVVQPERRLPALLVYHRRGADHVKVFEGARVLLNQVQISGIRRLYSGDALVVGERQCVYVQDDVDAEVAIGLTMYRHGSPSHAVVVRGTTVQIGGQSAQVAMPGGAPASCDLVIECHGTHALFLWDRSGRSKACVDGQLVEGRHRLKEGSLIQVAGHVMALSVLPGDGNGLLVPLEGAEVSDQAAPFVDDDLPEPTSREPTPAAPEMEQFPDVPPTIVGSLARILKEQESLDMAQGQEAAGKGKRADTVGTARQAPARRGNKAADSIRGRNKEAAVEPPRLPESRPRFHNRVTDLLIRRDTRVPLTTPDAVSSRSTRAGRGDWDDPSQPRSVQGARAFRAGLLTKHLADGQPTAADPSDSRPQQNIPLTEVLEVNSSRPDADSTAGPNPRKPAKGAAGRGRGTAGEGGARRRPKAVVNRPQKRRRGPDSDRSRKSADDN
jgi:hypothetical protein